MECPDTLKRGSRSRLERGSGRPGSAFHRVCTLRYLQRFTGRPRSAGIT
ncbi:hypothetical protein [Thermococcus aciditolerans]|nr:hypothetical protein [Thermococcus aciditolerans]